jgi:hypothetical protein
MRPGRVKRRISPPWNPRHPELFTITDLTSSGKIYGVGFLNSPFASIRSLIFAHSFIDSFGCLPILPLLDTVCEWYGFQDEGEGGGI